MNIWRFLKKCVTDRPAALSSSKLVIRSFYGQLYWLLNPTKALAFDLPGGGTLLLEPKHSFTHCFWPATDHYEPDVKEVLNYLLKAGNTFIDCGANIGYFSVQAGKIVGEQGQIVAIEANPITYKLLKRNLNKNNFGTSVHCALTSKAGEVEIFMPEAGDVYSSLRVGGLVTGESIRSFIVKSHTLDEIVEQLALTQVDVVKIDIEGGELDVLQSASQVIDRFRPTFVIEYSTITWSSFGASPEALQELITKYNYILKSFDLTKKQLVSLDENVWKSTYVNLILIAQEKYTEM